MRLGEYLKMEKIKPYKWARQHGFGQGTVYAWLNGRSRPRLEVALRIKQLTGGEVRPDDWNGEAP